MAAVPTSRESSGMVKDEAYRIGREAPLMRKHAEKIDAQLDI